MNTFFKIIFLFVAFQLLGCSNLNLDSISYSRIELTGPESLAISNVINIYKDSIDVSLDNIIGFSDQLYTKGDFNSKRFNSTLGNLIADILFIQSDSVFKFQENKNIDIVIQNYGGIRASLPKGEVKLTDAYKILPFENEIVIVEMSGESLSEIVSFLKTENKPHPFSGLTINGNEVLVQNNPIKPSNKYYIAINDYLLTGGDNMFFFNKNTDVYRLGYSLRDAFIDYTKSNLYLSSKIDNRFITDE
ncbi:MAG: 5'-nucleotidase C-terminal domain-containing protein [Candidatus Marisimplicoccus sp.]